MRNRGTWVAVSVCLVTQIAIVVCMAVKIVKLLKEKERMIIENKVKQSQMFVYGHREGWEDAKKHFEKEVNNGQS